jgi:hypothetical protein
VTSGIGGGHQPGQGGLGAAVVDDVGGQFDTLARVSTLSATRKAAAALSSTMSR